MHSPISEHSTPQAPYTVKLLAAVLAVCVLLGTATMFFSDFLDYGAESTSIAALQRVAASLPHLTGITENPIHLN
ncbi:MAG: hypothetical protein RL334_1606, partial [Chloroflexota bacterium]